MFRENPRCGSRGAKKNYIFVAMRLLNQQWRNILVNPEASDSASFGANRAIRPLLGSGRYVNDLTVLSN